MSTPIEVLFHHGANCSCEQCQRVVKPFQSGKFLSKAEIDEINGNIQALVHENRKLQAMVEKLTEEKVLAQQAAQEQAVAVAKAEQEVEEEVPKQATQNPNPKSVTITIDTSNLVYIAVIVVLLIMVLKK
jgi:hypothetical protein